MEHGELGMVSAAVMRGEAPVKLIRFSLDPDDGWWLLAEQDLPMPEVDNLLTVCIHCAIETMDREVGAGLDLARSEAEVDAGRLGLAFWHDGQWLTGDEADELGVLPL